MKCPKTNTYSVITCVAIFEYEKAGRITVSTTLQQLDLIDLISERHMQLRGLITEQWNQISDIYISNSEWYIMARLYKEQQPTPISHITKHVDISRQATHKFIRNMEAKGLVSIHNMENNKKVKCLRLTPLGEQCYETNVSIKAKIDEQIAAAIGSEQLQQLKDILRTNWGLHDD